MSIFKLDVIHKVTYSAILLVLIILFTRVLAVGNIEPVPFLRISIGPSLIVLSSLLLGPIYGGIIGGLSDILGILIFPNAYSINPLFTLVYVLFGIFPAITYYFVKKIKNDKSLFILNCVLVSLIFAFIVIFLSLTNEFTLFGHNYNFDVLTKTLVIIGSFVALSLIVVAIFFINKFLNKPNSKFKISVYRLSFIIIINNVLWMLILNTIVKTFFFEIDFFIILFSQAVTFLIDVLIASYLVPYLLLLIAKIDKSQIIEL